MPELRIILDAETLGAITQHVQTGRQPWAIVNEATGDELQFEPDAPVPGCVTVTVRQP